MATLLIIQSHKEAKEQLFRNWPHLQLPGWDILGVTPENSIHTWPATIRHCEMIGQTSGYSTPDLIKRWVATWERVLTGVTYAQYSDFFMCEADSVFLHKPPEHPTGLVTRLSGGPITGFKAKQFYHFPMWADRHAAGILVDEGRKLMAEGEFENGSPDFFLGLIVDRRPELQLHECNSFSVNGGDLTNRKADALKAIANGAFFLHGLRTQEELDWIMEARDKYARDTQTTDKISQGRS